MDKECHIEKIDGVDMFNGKHGSGDCDGNNFTWTNLDREYILLVDKYRDDDNKNIYKARTDTYLKSVPDNTYDLIYIDADHSYNGVKRDIELSFKKIKNGGFIMGHDYEMNMEKAKTHYNFGVKEAVDEFCEKNNQEIIAKGNDGCVSFCIKIKK